MDVIIPTDLVCILFGPAIPTSSFNIIFYTCYRSFFIALRAKPVPLFHVLQQYYHSWIQYQKFGLSVHMQYWTFDFRLPDRRGPWSEW
jgi:hypothetical protein